VEREVEDSSVAIEHFVSHTVSLFVASFAGHYHRKATKHPANFRNP